MINFRILYILPVLISIHSGCGNKKQIEELFPIVTGQTDSCIAVYGSGSVSQEQYDRAYRDILLLMDQMHSRIKTGLLNSQAKIFVVRNEDELSSNSDLVMTLLPAEAIFTDLDGVDETIESGYGTGLSTTLLESMNLVVYYSLLTEPGLSGVYEELQDAYREARDEGVFIPGKKYRDGTMDDIHRNASLNNALKYGRYLFCIYAVYYGNDTGGPPDMSIHEKEKLKIINPRGYFFVQQYLSTEYHKI